MEFLFDVVSLFFDVQVNILLKLSGISSMSHYGMHPNAEAWLFDVCKLSLLILEVIGFRAAISGLTKWYESRSYEYTKYLERKRALKFN